MRTVQYKFIVSVFQIFAFHISEMSYVIHIIPIYLAPVL
jgi:hypothetical protein